MRICRFDDNRVGIVAGDEIADVTHALDILPSVRWPLPCHDLFIEKLPDIAADLQRAAASAPRKNIADVRLLSPVANPGKIIGAPVNYALHMEEAKTDSAINLGKTIRSIDEAGLFLKANSSLIGPGESVIAGQFGRRTDHEIELAFVIGRGGRNISEANALDHVAGYMIGLDMTIRGVEDRSYRKSLDTFTVLGPWLVTPDEFGDPSNVDFEIKVNGETRQKSNTTHLIYGIRKLISYASHAYRLDRGDVILSGTPEGVGPVVPGDVMECWIDRIGTMVVQVAGKPS